MQLFKLRNCETAAPLKTKATKRIFELHDIEVVNCQCPAGTKAKTSSTLQPTNEPAIDLVNPKSLNPKVQILTN